jgi:hypothetical protein
MHRHDETGSRCFWWGGQQLKLVAVPPPAGDLRATEEDPAGHLLTSRPQQGFFHEGSQLGDIFTGQGRTGLDIDQDPTYEPKAQRGLAP